MTDSDEEMEKIIEEFIERCSKSKWATEWAEGIMGITEEEAKRNPVLWKVFERIRRRACESLATKLRAELASPGDVRFLLKLVEKKMK